MAADIYMLIIDLLEHTAVSVELKKEMLAVRHRTVCLVSPPLHTILRSKFGLFIPAEDWRWPEALPICNP